MRQGKRFPENGPLPPVQTKTAKGLSDHQKRAGERGGELLPLYERTGDRVRYRAVRSAPRIPLHGDDPYPGLDAPHFHSAKSGRCRDAEHTAVCLCNPGGTGFP